MTAVSLYRDPGDAKLPAADEQPRHERPWRTAFVLSAIVGWSALAAWWPLAVVGEMFAAVTLLTVSASAFAAAGVAATFLPCPFTGYPSVTHADLAAFHGDQPKVPAALHDAPILGLATAEPAARHCYRNRGRACRTAEPAPRRNHWPDWPSSICRRLDAQPSHSVRQRSHQWPEADMSAAGVTIGG